MQCYLKKKKSYTRLKKKKTNATRYIKKNHVILIDFGLSIYAPTGDFFFFFFFFFFFLLRWNMNYVVVVW